MRATSRCMDERMNERMDGRTCVHIHNTYIGRVALLDNENHISARGAATIARLWRRGVKLLLYSAVWRTRRSACACVRRSYHAFEKRAREGWCWRGTGKNRGRGRKNKRERERERERDINRRDGMKQKIMPSTRACVRVRAQISSIRRDRPEVAPFSFGNFWGRDIVYRSPSPHSRHRCHPVKTGGKRVRLPRKGSEWLSQHGRTQMVLGWRIAWWGQLSQWWSGGEGGYYPALALYPPRDLAAVAMANSLSPRILSGRLYFRLTSNESDVRRHCPRGAFIGSIKCLLLNFGLPGFRVSRTVRRVWISPRSCATDKKRNPRDPTSSINDKARDERRVLIIAFLSGFWKAGHHRWMKFDARSIPRFGVRRGTPTPLSLNEPFLPFFIDFQDPASRARWKEKKEGKRQRNFPLFFSIHFHFMRDVMQKPVRFAFAISCVHTYCRTKRIAISGSSGTIWLRDATIWRDMTRCYTPVARLAREAQQWAA